MKRLTFAVPGSLDSPTGGYAYDRRIILEMCHLGWDIEVINLGEGFPYPDAATRASARTLLSQIGAGLPIVIDGLALGVLPAEAAALCARHPLIALVHHPLALESGLSKEQAEKFRQSERTALAPARSVIVTSAATAQLLREQYGVAADRLTVAPPGNDPVPKAVGSKDGVVRLLAVGSLVPRKGYDVLLAALATLIELPWQLTIAGDDTRDRATAASVGADIARLGLTGRVHLAGVVAPERLSAIYLGADVFVLASRFEGYGMAFTEAVAHGLPVIGTTAGAIPEAVPAGTGLLVAPDDPAALAGALRRLIANTNERQQFAAAARRAAAGLPTWRDSAVLFAKAIMAIA